MSEDAATAVSEAPDASASSAEFVATEAASPTTNQGESTQDHQANVDRDWFKANPADGEPKEAASDETEATDADAEQAPPAVETPKVDGYEGITKPQADTLKRFKVSPTVWGKLDTEERTELLSNLEENVRYVSRLGQEAAALRKGLPNQSNPAETAQATTAAQPAANAQQNPPPAQADGAHWKPFSEYGEDFGKNLQGVFSAELSPITQQMQQLAQMQQQMQTLVNDFGQRMYDEDRDAAFDELVLPDGIDKSNPEIRKAIEARALEQFGPDLSGFSFKGRPMRSAIQTAASALFQKQAQQAAQAQQKTRVQSHLRASPTRTTAAATATTIKMTPEEIDKVTLQGIDQGLKGKALQQFIDKAGQR